MIFSVELFRINVICIIESEKNLINMLNIIMKADKKRAVAVPTQFEGTSNYHISKHHQNPSIFSPILRLAFQNGQSCYLKFNSILLR